MTSDLTEIGRVHGAADLSLIRAAFDATDIPLFILHGDMVRLYAHASIGLGGAILAVPSSRAQEALGLLHALMPLQTTRSHWSFVCVALLCLLLGLGAGVGINATFPTSARAKIRAKILDP